MKVASNACAPKKLDLNVLILNRLLYVTKNKLSIYLCCYN
jgi:hypothetical protein